MDCAASAIVCSISSLVSQGSCFLRPGQWQVQINVWVFLSKAEVVGVVVELSFWHGFHRGESLSLKEIVNWGNQSHQLNDFLADMR